MSKFNIGDGGTVIVIGGKRISDPDTPFGSTYEKRETAHAHAHESMNGQTMLVNFHGGTHRPDLVSDISQAIFV